MRILRHIALAASTALLLASCGRSQKSATAEATAAPAPPVATASGPVPMDLTKLLPPGEEALEDANYTEPSRQVKGLGLHARGQQNTVIVSIKNNTGRQLALIPKDFALLTGRDPRRDLVFINANTADMKTFPAVMLEDDATFSFPLRMLAVPNVQRMALVYNNPRNGIKFAVPVE